MRKKKHHKMNSNTAKQKNLTEINRKIKSYKLLDEINLHVSNICKL